MVYLPRRKASICMAMISFWAVENYPNPSMFGLALNQQQNNGIERYPPNQQKNRVLSKSIKQREDTDSKSTKNSKVMESTSTWSYKSKKTKSGESPTSRISKGKSTKEITAKTKKASKDLQTKSTKHSTTELEEIETVLMPVASKPKSSKSFKNGNAENGEILENNFYPKSQKVSKSLKGSPKSTKATKSPVTVEWSFKSKTPKETKAPKNPTTDAKAAKSPKNYTKSQKSSKTTKSPKNDTKSAKSPKSQKSSNGTKTPKYQTEIPTQSPIVNTSNPTALPTVLITEPSPSPSSATILAANPTPPPSPVPTASDTAIVTFTNPAPVDELQNIIYCNVNALEDTDYGELTTIQFDYEVEVSQMDIDDNEEVDEVLNRLEAAIMSHLGLVPGCITNEIRKLREMGRRQLKLVSMELAGPRNIAENTCVAGRSDASCEVTTSTTIEVVTTGGDSKSDEVCIVLASIKNFFDDVYQSGNVYGIDEVEFKGSDFDCSDAPSGLQDDFEKSSEFESHLFIGWYFVFGMGAMILVAFLINSYRSKKSEDEHENEEENCLKVYEDTDSEASGIHESATRKMFF